MTYLTRILFIIILGILTLALLLQFGEFELSLATLQSLNLGYLILAICIHYSGFFVRGLRWKNLLGALDYPLSITYTTSLLLAGWFVSAVLPARLGDVARLTMLHRDHQIPIAQGVASVASERALDILAILGLMMITAFWALAGQVPSFVWQLAAGGAGLLILFVIICVISPNLENWFLNLLSWPIYQKVVKFGFDLLANLRRLGQRPKLLLWVISLSIYIWLCDVLLMHLLFLSMGQTIAFSVSAFSSMVADMAAAVPVVPGAIGQFEGAAVAVFSLFDIGLQQSSLVILLNRLVSFWTFLIFSGLVTYFFGFAQIFKTATLQKQEN